MPFFWSFLSLAALIISFYQQYIAGHEPCFYCLGQRWGFILILGGAMAFYFGKSRHLLLPLAAAFVFLAYFSARHSLIELGYLEDCQTFYANTVDELFEGFENSQSCKSKTFTLLGIPVQFLNFFLAVAGGVDALRRYLFTKQ